MKESDRRNSDKRELPATDNEPADAEPDERASKDYYYDDSTGYESYEREEEDDGETEQTPESSSVNQGMHHADAMPHRGQLLPRSRG